MGHLTRLHGAPFELLARTLIGRSPACDLQVDHPTVSGEHAVLSWENNGWQVRDLGSRNGTRLDGRPLDPGALVPIVEGAMLQFGRAPETLRVSSVAPPGRPGDVAATAGASLVMESLTLRFVVSRDEEHVSWSAEQGGRVVDLGDRVHTYLILTLARRRLEDAEAPPSTRGWCDAEDLARRLRITPEVLKVYVYRARQQLLRAGVVGADGVVERRSSTQQIRLGTDQLVIERR